MDGRASSYLLQARSACLVCASSSCPARNYREPSNPDEAACASVALCALIHSTWTAPPGLERATGYLFGFYIYRFITFHFIPI